MGEAAQLSCSITPPSSKTNQETNFCNLERLEGGVYMLNFSGHLQHRFSPESIRLINELLDQVTRDGRACAMITTNQDKFFSNGMDVNYLRKCDRQGAIEYVLIFQRLVSKLLTFSIPTIAVIRGHAVGAGCIFVLAHDYRLMISSRGCIFMNEIDLGLPLTPGIMAILRSKLHPSSFQEAILTGKRYNGKEAAVAGIVHAAGPMGPTLLKEGIKKPWNTKQRIGKERCIMR